MQDIIDMKLEEYIPLKIIFNKDEEAVEHISYSKDKTSSLEFTVGIKSKLLKRITLLLCKEYSETTNKLVVENFEDGKIVFHSDDIECPVFKTILYSNGTRIILSDKKSSHYIKMDKVYFGLSETDDIIEICVCDMSVSELEHLKKELELQWVKRSARWYLSTGADSRRDGRGDPNTDEVINWTPEESGKGVWDMEHIPEAKYSEMHEAYMNGKLITKEFDWYNDLAK